MGDGRSPGKSHGRSPRRRYGRCTCLGGRAGSRRGCCGRSTSGSGCGRRGGVPLLQLALPVRLHFPPRLVLRGARLRQRLVLLSVGVHAAPRGAQLVIKAEIILGRYPQLMADEWISGGKGGGKGME